jgi:hypothetical protein
MSPGASAIRRPVRQAHGVLWPSVVAILFATFAAISFAVDQSVGVSILSNLPIETEGQ